MLSFKQFSEAVIHVDFKSKKLLGNLKQAPNDHVNTWMDKHISSDDNVTTPKKTAYDHYREWSHNSGIAPHSENDFHSVVSQRFMPHKFAGALRYNALKINDLSEGINIAPNMLNAMGVATSLAAGNPKLAALHGAGLAVGAASSAINRYLKKRKEKKALPIKPVTESNHEPITFYNDAAPPPDDKISVNSEKVHKWVRRHTANMYTIQHIQRNLPDGYPNLKIHYTNQMAIARRKRDYWINKPIPGSGGSAHYYDRSKAQQDTHHARIASHEKLTELGYTNLSPPPKMKEDPKVAALPKSADGRIQFGVTKK